MTETISQGDFLTVEDPGDQTLIEVVSGEVKTGPTEIEAANSDISFTAASHRYEYHALHGEDLVLFAVQDSEVALQVNEGFRITLFDRLEFNTDIVAQTLGDLDTRIADQVGNLATDIAEQTVGNLDTRIADQVGDVATDIANQSVAELTSDTARQSSRGMVEVNADSTTDVPAGQSLTITTNAAAGELWVLRYAKAEISWTNFDTGPVKLQYVSENQGIPLTGVISQETSAENTGSLQLRSIDHTSMEGARVDANDGISLIVTNDENDESITDTITNRFQFEVFAI